MNLVLSFRIIGYFRNINCLLGDSQQLANPNQGELGSCDDGGEFVVSCPLVRTIQTVMSSAGFISRADGMKTASPLYPQKRTFVSALSMSAFCQIQKRSTLPAPAHVTFWMSGSFLVRSGVE